MYNGQRYPFWAKINIICNAPQGIQIEKCILNNIVLYSVNCQLISITNGNLNIEMYCI